MNLVNSVTSPVGHRADEPVVVGQEVAVQPLGVLVGTHHQQPAEQQPGYSLHPAWGQIGLD